MVGSGGNRRRFIIEVILDLKTIVKVVEQGVEGLKR
jgi:hypothetical protein